MKINIPAEAKNIIEVLTTAGYEAYVVGGCVRDSVIGKEPKDWDITTSAKPEEVKALFKRCVDTGIKHGTITIMCGKVGYEVTTYRVDGEYEDHRHPKQVEFTANLSEDLRRRDFTINAMAYNDKDGLVDLFNGIDDINNRKIRCVGDPDERFEEDALRMLRAVRFAAQLDYEIVDSTKAAIVKKASTLSQVSAERIREEFVKLLVSSHPEKILDMRDLGLLEVFLPEMVTAFYCEQNNPHHCYTVGLHILEAIKGVPEDKDLRLAALLHDIGKPAVKSTDVVKNRDHFYGHEEKSAQMAKDILKRLKFDNKTLEKVVLLVRYHDYFRKKAVNEKEVRIALGLVGKENISDLFTLMYSDMCAQSTYDREEKQARLDKWKALTRVVIERGDCVSIKELAITGSDLIAIGVKPSKEMGQLLDSLLQLVIETPELNQKEYLLKKAEEFIKE